ncbi:hypothetical protein [Treponema putidum]|uniref:hypothetical protein n=1 Tax=Treponema putidum TaxID=221027 RepID=UPI003D946450
MTREIKNKYKSSYFFTPLEIKRIDKIFFVKGVVVINTNSEKKLLPYGGADTDRQLAIQKALSELVERIVWWELFSRYMKIFPNTIGFAAHIDFISCIDNSLSEFIERIVFSSVIKNLKTKKNYVNLKKYYKIRKIDNSIVFITKQHEREIYYSIYTKIVTNDINGFTTEGVIFGLGKNKNQDFAINDSKYESTLIANSVFNLIKGSKSIAKNNSAYIEAVHFLELFKNMTILNNCKNINESPINSPVPILDDISYAVFDVSSYIPDILKPLKRYVCFTCDLKKKDFIEKNCILNNPIQIFPAMRRKYE